MATAWSSLDPQQTAQELEAYPTISGVSPTATVPGTSLTFGDLNQSQQLALMYANCFGTGGTDLQDFLTQNAGPNASWNLSYNQIQADPQLAQIAQSPLT